MSDIKIPPEAVEAAVEAIRPLRHNPFITDRQLTRAAIRATLAAWPGMRPHEKMVPDDSDEIRYAIKTVGIILPLSQETRDDRR